MDKKDYLNFMGIETWSEKDKASCFAKATQNAWDELEKRAKVCTLCDLSKTRTHVVFGSGNRNAQLLVVGEAPGQNEDLQGLPFVGRGGQLLTNMLKSIGLDREQIYIANILKCRPPQNRDPNPIEVATCTPYLLQQIELLQPKIILAVGRIAAQFLLNTDEAMARLRGQEFNYHDTPLLVTYHPAYLLRSPRDKRKSWDDMLRLQKYLK
jgi:uracil-DNA glycosylase family 4